MDKKAFVKALKNVILEFENKNQEFSLFMIIPTEPFYIYKNYSVVVSAPWLDNKNPKEAIDLILWAFIDQIGSTHSPLYLMVNRINVIRSNDRFVTDLTSNFTVNVNNEETFINKLYVSGALLENATLLVSNEITGNEKKTSTVAAMTPEL